MIEKYLLNVNGFETEASYDSEDVENVFIPLIHKFNEIYEEKGRRVFIFMAAPPGLGKTTLTLFLEQLAVEQGITQLQAVGMDGFHYDQQYLDNTLIERNGNVFPLAAIKGSKDTFDIDKLCQKLQQASEGDCYWPLYDRNIHNPVEDAVEINKDIILFEGNYLLLDDENWARVREYCDYSVLLRCQPELLEERLINRKVRGNVSLEFAKKWYQQVDGQNVNTVLNNSIDADCVIIYDGEHYKFQTF